MSETFSACETCTQFCHSVTHQEKFNLTKLNLSWKIQTVITTEVVHSWQRRCKRSRGERERDRELTSVIEKMILILSIKEEYIYIYMKMILFGLSEKFEKKNERFFLSTEAD